MVRWPLAPGPSGAHLRITARRRIPGARTSCSSPLVLAALPVLALAVSGLAFALNGIGGASAGPAAGIPSPEPSPTGRPLPPSGLIQLTAISTGFNDPVGIDHHAPNNQVVMSVNTGAGGVPHNFELVSGDGSRTRFSDISGLRDEVKIATVRDRRGGFTPGELFVGTGEAGVVARISEDGSTIQNPWVTLPGEEGLLRGSLHVDRTGGAFGGDLIVVTTTGGVWRVNSSGEAEQLANLNNTHLEGVTTVPNEERYGPWAARILAGAEDEGRIYAIGPDGSVDFYELEIKPEDLDIIAPNENFFGVDFGGQTLWGATPDQFAGMVGDVLVTQEEPGILWHVRWNGTQFEKRELVRVELWEHVTFSTAGIVEVAPLPPTTTDDSGPSPLLLVAAGLLAILVAGGGAALLAQRRRRAAAAAGTQAPLRRPAGRDPAAPVYAGTGPLGDPRKAEAWLEVEEGEIVNRFPLSEDPVTVGFGGDCTIRLPEGTGPLSTRARVWKREGRYMLHNLSRLGGVVVAGKPATWAILEDGDVIEMGSAKLTFRTADPQIAES
jgi:hypothetical protein